MEFAAYLLVGLAIGALAAWLFNRETRRQLLRLSGAFRGDVLRPAVEQSWLEEFVVRIRQRGDAALARQPALPESTKPLHARSAGIRECGRFQRSKDLSNERHRECTARSRGTAQCNW